MKNVSRDVRYLWPREPGQALEASEHAHSTKDIGRLCFYLVLVWAEHRKILPYAKSDRQKRSPWSRLAADEVREDSQHDQPVSVHCSRSARLFLIIFCNLLVIIFLRYNVRSGPILYHVWDATASDSRFSHHIQDTNPGSCDQGRKCKGAGAAVAAADARPLRVPCPEFERERIALRLRCVEHT